MGIDFQAVMSSYTISAIMFACEFFFEIRELHEFFNKFVKRDVREINQNPRFENRYMQGKV